MKQHPFVHLGLGLCVALAAFASQPSLPSRAAPSGGNIYIVDRSDDVIGANACTVLPNDCSLRGALIGANANPYSTIVFSGTHNITLNSPLNLTAAGTLIDSQGLQVSIHLSTTPTVAGNVFKISAEDVILRGLAINGSSANFANVWVTGAATKNVLIESNRIGLDLNGNCASPDSSDGIYVDATGTPGAGENLITINQNLISCVTAGDGIEIHYANKARVIENQIADSQNGVWINRGKDNTLSQNRIGSNATGVRITGNGANDSTSATGNVLQRNLIACGFGCSPSLNNGNAGGILIENGAYLNTVGSATFGAENEIFNNTAYGIRIADSNQNYIGGNFIGAPQGGFDVYPNLNGIELLNASGTFIGPLGPGGRGNLISGNDGDGILLSNGTRFSTIIGNAIGPNFALTGTLVNLGSGIRIEGGANRNVIGGSDASLRELAARPDDNIIAGNSYGGVFIAGASTTSNTVGGNQIGYADINGTIVALGNPSEGVYLDGSGKGNRIIGAAFAYNVNGIYVKNGGFNTIQNSVVYSSVEHGIVLSGTIFNNIEMVALEGNGRDGLTERYSAGNTWVPAWVRGNGGLGIDRDAPNDTLNQPSTHPAYLMTTITDYNRDTGVVTGTGIAHIFPPSFTDIHVYGVVNSDRDPSGYGEGSYYLGSAPVINNAGDWSFTLSEGERLVFPCVTAITYVFGADIFSASGSSEFSQNVCRPSKVFVPAVVR
jgi:parallel beta-helix repeat protein